MQPTQQRRPRQRGREFFALIFAFLITVVLGKIIMPPQSNGPLLLQIVVYVLLYGTLYMLFWWLGGQVFARRRP